MEEDSIITIILIVALVAMSAFFSASETAFSSLNLIRLRSRSEAGDKPAGKALNLAEKFDRLLSTILIGNNIVNIAAASLGTVFFCSLLGPVYGPTASTVALTVIVLIFGEITPKGLAKEMSETLAVAFSPILIALVTLFTPLNFIFGKWKDFLARRFHSDERDTVTEGELVTMVSEAEKDGEITDRESELIRSAISFDDVEVEDVLIPRVDVVAVADDVVEEVRPQSNGSWLIAGDAGVDDVAEELSIRDKSKAVSISGLVQEKLGGLPKVGDHFRWGKYEGIVTRTTHRRVQEVRLTLMEPEAVPQE